MNKRDFKAEVVNILLDAIRANFNVNRHVETVLTSKNNGFYFRFSAYGQQLQILVFPNGNLAVKFKKSFNKEQLSNYYFYSEEDNHEALMPIIEQDFTLLVQDFYKGMDYHILIEQKIQLTLSRSEQDWSQIYSQLRT